MSGGHIGAAPHHQLASPARPPRSRGATERYPPMSSVPGQIRRTFLVPLLLAGAALCGCSSAAPNKSGGNQVDARTSDTGGSSGATGGSSGAATGGTGGSETGGTGGSATGGAVGSSTGGSGGSSSGGADSGVSGGADSGT